MRRMNKTMWARRMAVWDQERSREKGGLGVGKDWVWQQWHPNTFQPQSTFIGLCGFAPFMELVQVQVDLVAWQDLGTEQGKKCLFT